MGCCEIDNCGVALLTFVNGFETERMITTWVKPWMKKKTVFHVCFACVAIGLTFSLCIALRHRRQAIGHKLCIMLISNWGFV